MSDHLARNSTLADDLLSGAEEIAGFIGASQRRGFYLLETKKLPGFKIGSRWHARKSTLLKWITDQEAAGASE